MSANKSSHRVRQHRLTGQWIAQPAADCGWLVVTPEWTP